MVITFDLVPQGKLSDVWANVTKAAIAEAILNLTKLDAKHRGPDVCPTTPTVSLLVIEGGGGWCMPHSVIWSEWII